MFGILFGANATSSTGPIICVMRPRFVSVLVDGVILEKNSIRIIVDHKFLLDGPIVKIHLQ